MAKRFLKVTKTNRVEVTDLIPGDEISDSEQNSGTIADVKGSVKNGLLTWAVMLNGGDKPRFNTYIFKLIKA